MHMDTRCEAGSGEISTIRSRDALDHGQNIHGWQLECIQLSSGIFEGVISELLLDHFQIVRETTNQALIKRGASWANSIVMSLPIAASGRGWLGGRELPSGATLLSDGNELPEIRTPTQLDLICIAFDRYWFAIKALEAGYVHLAERVWRQDRFSIPERHRAALGDLIVSIFEEVERRASILEHAASRAALENAILDSLFAALSQSVSVTVSGETPRKKLADHVRHVVLRDPAEAPNLAEICRKLGISRAHLQNCFRLSYGLTATQMLRAARLHGVRRELRDARLAGRAVSIGDVAARWGFWHWSRFTADYRRHYAELPSITLKAAREALL